MRPISKQKKIRILRRLFSGETYREAAREEGVSISTVKMVYDEFVGRAAASSLEEASEEYGILDEIEILREIAVEKMKADLSLPELLETARLAALMKKLDLSPVNLQNLLEMYEKHKHDFGDFARDALSLSRLEKETGKTYKGVITQYKKKVENLRELGEEETKLKSKIQDLTRERDTITGQLEELHRKSKIAQNVLDELNNTREELAEFGLKPSDLTIIKNFLREIHNLGGDAAKAVEILEETSSLEDNLEKGASKLERLKKEHEEEIRTHNKRVHELELRVENLTKKIEEEEDVLRQRHIEKTKVQEEIKDLKKLRVALENTVDRLLRKQAVQLKVQPDIDLVSEALPIRKKELEELNSEITKRKLMADVAKALEALFAKKPYDRDAIIRLLKPAKHDTTYGSLDASVRQAMVKLMAEQGFVPVQELETVERNAENKIDSYEKNTKALVEMWNRIAQKRLDELNEYLEQAGKERRAKDKEMEEHLIHRASDLMAKLIWKT